MHLLERTLSILKGLIAARQVAKDDATFLRTAAINASRSNSVISNFFGYRHSIGEWIEKTGMVVPRTMLEIGCGHIPWTGLRFLLEGTQRYVANDTMNVRKSFPAQELADLRSVCAWVQPSLLDRWSEVAGGGQSEIFPVGLEIRDGAGFETQSYLNQDFDFTTSTSVLEHVMDPEGVYRKLAEVTRPGGWMFHSIDLRDHRFLQSLALQVQEGLKHNPHAGDLYVFRGRSGSLLKILWHDGIGMSLYAKRLERGRFVWPSATSGVVSISASQLAYMLDGIDWRNPQHMWRPTAAG
jgi:transposase